MSITSLLPNLSAQAIRAAGLEVEARSQITPDVSVRLYDDGAGVQLEHSAPPSGFGSAVMGMIRPAIYIHTPAGTYPIEPWGAPRKNLMPHMVVGGCALGYLAWKGYQAWRRGR